MRDRGQDRRDFIRHLGEDLRERGFDVRETRPDLDLSHLPELRSLLGRPDAFGKDGLTGIVARESDYGYLAGNIENFEKRIEIARVLGEIGVIPRVAQKEGGLLRSLSQAMDAMTDMDRDLRFALGEMAHQGLRELEDRTGAPDHRMTRDILSGSVEAAGDFAREHNLDLVRAPDPQRMMAFPKEELVALLKGTDPDMGLGPIQSGAVAAAKPGLAGPMRQSFIKGNLRDAVEKLAEAGFAPFLSLKPFEATKGLGFMGRLKEKAAYVLAGPDLDTYSRSILEFGRVMVRLRIDDLMHENRLGRAPDMEKSSPSDIGAP